jgi:iron complex outermembrane receptor protein
MALLNRQFYFFLFLFTILSIAWPVSSVADGPESAPVIMITPTRTLQTQNTSSSTVYVLNRQQVEQSGARTTTELLRGMPGIQIDDLFGNGVEVSISVRGFSSTANANTLILVNGRRLNHSDTASPDLHHIFPKDIERIEVLAGSAGALYGDQAVGGVINIITRKALKNRTLAALEIGSFDYRSAKFSTSRSVNETLGYRFSAERFESDHYRDNNSESNANLHGLIEYSKRNHSVFLEIQSIEDKLELPGALLKNEFDADPAQSNAGFINDFINEDTRVLSVGYQFDLEAQQFSVDLTRRETDADVLQSFRNSPSPSAGFITRENISLNPKLSGVWMLSDYKIPYVTGIDVDDSDYDLFLPNSLGTTTAETAQRTESLFFQVRPQLTQKVQLTLGARHSSIDKDMKDGFSFPSGLNIKDDVQVAEFGLLYRVRENLNWSLRFDENFRFAKINELAQAESGQILDTQTGNSYEAGLQWKSENHQITASVYRLDLENEIVFDPTVGPDFGFGPSGANVNLRKTRRDGLTLSLTNRLLPHLTLNTELGLVNARYESGTFEGKQISGVADRVIKIRADYSFTSTLTSYLEAHHKGEHYAQGDNANAFDRLSAINVMNAGLRYVYDNLEVSLRINNLADKKYAEFITNNGFGAAYQPSPERNFVLSAQYRFQ